MSQYPENERKDPIQKIQAQRSQLKHGEGRLGRLFITGKIIIDPDGQIIDYELNSPFTYLRYRHEGLNTPQSYPVRDSEQVRLGALEILNVEC